MPSSPRPSASSWKNMLSWPRSSLTRGSLPTICASTPDINRCNSDTLKYTICKLSLFVDNPDYECVIRSDIEELQKMSMKRGKLIGAITKNYYVISKINSKIIHATSNVMAKPKGTTQRKENAARAART